MDSQLISNAQTLLNAARAATKSMYFYGLIPFFIQTAQYGYVQRLYSRRVQTVTVRLYVTSIRYLSHRTLEAIFQET